MQMPMYQKLLMCTQHSTKNHAISMDHFHQFGYIHSKWLLKPHRNAFKTIISHESVVIFENNESNTGQHSFGKMRDTLFAIIEHCLEEATNSEFLFQVEIFNKE